MLCFFTSDLHGRVRRYDRLFAAILAERPDAVFLGGDLLPSGSMVPGLVIGDPLPDGPGVGDPAPGSAPTVVPAESARFDFVHGFLAPRCESLRREMGDAYPEIFLILGNDDARSEEAAFLEAEARGHWHYAHERRFPLGRFDVYGYACVPPTPFLLKDWERYDVSRFVDPGCVSPEEGYRSVPVDPDRIKWTTIAKELRALAGVDDLSSAIFLFHSPPHGTALDRAALDGLKVEHVPLDVHVGSVAIRRFLEERGPLISLHGHVHEAPRLTGTWRARVGRTQAFCGAHDGPELALVRFDPEEPEGAERELV